MNERRRRKERRRKDEGFEGDRKDRRRKDAGFVGERKEGVLGRKDCRSRMSGGGDMFVEHFLSNHLFSCYQVIGFRIVSVFICVTLSRPEGGQRLDLT